MTAPSDLPPPSSGPRHWIVPPGDDRLRLTCPDCGYVAYENPLIIVGSVATWGERILLCRRAIPPRYGYWTLPAGFMELKETTEQGAAREALEEAGAVIRVGALLAVYNLPRISQVQMIYRAELVEPTLAAGPESLDVGLFCWEDIPWMELAFPTVAWALHAWKEHRNTPALLPVGNPADPAAAENP